MPGLQASQGLCARQACCCSLLQAQDESAGSAGSGLTQTVRLVLQMRSEPMQSTDVARHVLSTLVSRAGRSWL